jgi:hypothetical protein
MASNKTLSRQFGRGACAVLLAAGSVSGVLGASPTANAADAYVAVSVGLGNDNPPVQTIGGMGIGPDENQARIDSLSNCQGNGGGHCTFEMSAKNACAAAAANDAGEIEAASDPSVQTAENNAKAKLQSQAGAHVVVSGCANGNVQPPPPNSPNPPAPLQGPTVSFKSIIGGREADITDRSGVTSQCTYATDNFNRSFALQAHGTYNLKIVPAIPQGKNWTVTITCDNGTSTTANDFF